MKGLSNRSGIWRILLVLVVVFLLASTTAAQDNSTNSTSSNSTQDGYPRDPYLDYQPQFAYSVPIQILLTGMVVALCTVLLIHLLFTAQYHWPLARLNYALQLSGVTVLLISQISTLIIILRTTYTQSREWPYMLDYVAVRIPLKKKWSTVELVWWYIMQAVTSALVNITHIQFLTLLYPSPVEARLIFFLLGPLAVASSGMEFTALLSTNKAQDLGEAIRDICNSTLTLLFTAALFIWGFLLNRAQAWRTDGGTAVFGAGALTLAVISTAVNFVQISQEELEWLPGLLWALVLWQSFLGWWWWVGSGMGIGEVEDMLLREQKRKDARLRRRAKKDAKNGGKKSSRQNVSEGDEPNNNGTVVSRFTRHLTNARQRRQTTATEPEHEDISQSNNSSQSPHPEAGASSSFPNRSAALHHLSADVESSSISNTTLSASFWAFLERSWRRLRHAHLTATRVQAIEQVELRAQKYGPSNAELGGAGGWGLGNFGLREREEAERRLRELEGRRNQDQLIQNRSSIDDMYERDVEAQAGQASSSSQTPDDEIQVRPRESPQSTRAKPLPSKSSPDPPWAEGRSRMFWWWGPLRRWRLQDSTMYQ